MAVKNEQRVMHCASILAKKYGASLHHCSFSRMIFTLIYYYVTL